MTLSASPLPKTNRDHRVDFWRGVALVMIFINHVPGTLFENFTTRNFGFSDAAELFVFLAGFASAYAYGTLFLSGHRLAATLKAWRRAGVLYLVHITLTMAAFAIFGWAALALGHGEFLNRIGFAPFLTMPVETILGVATLGHQLGYVNILPMYTAMLLFLPVHLYLASIDKRLMLACATGLWILAYCFTIDMPAYPLPGGWFFNPFAWQILFALGLYAGLSRKENGVAFAYRPWLYAAALVYALICFVSVQYALWDLWNGLPFPVFVSGFDKTYVSIPRLAHILAVCYLFANAAPSSPFSNISRENPFAMLGRHSLPIFAIGTILSLCCQVIKNDGPPSFWPDLLMIGTGIAILFLVARYLEWWGEFSKVGVTKSRDPMAQSARGSIVGGRGDRSLTSASRS